MISYEDYQKMKWLAIYGSSIAIQANQLLMQGKGGSISFQMEKIKEEAKTIADLALEGEAP